MRPCPRSHRCSGGHPPRLPTAFPATVGQITELEGSLPRDELLHDSFVRDLHTRMLGLVWNWAGRWQRLELNNGIAPEQIAVELRNTLDDPLRDDGIRYGELVADAGVVVEVHNAETLVHGYLGYAGVVPAAIAAVDRGLAAMRAGLHQ